MKSVCRILILITGILFFACAPKSVKPPGLPEADTGEKMFRTAERLFEAKSYDKARGIYRDYYRLYPKRPAAPAALTASAAGPPPNPAWASNMAK